jgi:hypothetical protein
MADETLKRFLVELVYKIDEGGWSRFNQTINNTTIQINNFNQTINVLSQRMNVFTGGGGGGAGGGGGGGGGGGFMAGLNFGGLPGGHIFAAFARGGPIGGLIAGFGALGEIFKFTAKAGIETTQMFAGLYWAAQRTQAGVGGLFTAQGLDKMFGVPFGGTEQAMGMQLQRFGPLRQSLKRRFGIDIQTDQQGNISNLADVLVQMGKTWQAQGPGRFAAGEAEAQLYGIPTDVYATIRRDPMKVKREADYLKSVQERMGFSPEKMAEGADRLNRKMIELEQVFRVTLFTTFERFVNFLEANQGTLQAAFDRIEHFVEEVIKILAGEGGDIIKVPPLLGGREKEVPFVDPNDPEKGFGWWNTFKKWWQDNLPQASNGKTDDKAPDKHTDAVVKQTKATENLTDQLTKIAQAGTTFAGLGGGDIPGLPAWGDEGGGGGGARIKGGGYGGGGSSRTPPPPKGVQRERAMRLMQSLVDKGWSPTSAAIVAGNVQIESSFDPEAKGDPSVPGGSHGLVQWNRGRLAELKAFAAAKGKPWTDYDTQVEFIDKEWRKYGLSVHESDFSRAAEMGHKYEGYATATAGSRVGAGRGLLKQYQDRPTGKVAPVGTGNGATHHDARDQSMNQTNNITVSGFSDPHAAGTQIASAVNNTQKAAVRDFRTKFA